MGFFFCFGPKLKLRLSTVPITAQVLTHRNGLAPGNGRSHHSPTRLHRTATPRSRDLLPSHLPWVDLTCDMYLALWGSGHTSRQSPPKWVLPFSRSRSNPATGGGHQVGSCLDPRAPPSQGTRASSEMRLLLTSKYHIPELQPAGICPGSAAYSLCNPGGCTGSQVRVLTYTRGCPPKSFRSHVTSRVPWHRWGARAPCRTCAVVERPCYCTADARGTLPTHQPWPGSVGHTPGPNAH